MHRNQTRKDLTFIASNFPSLNPTIVHTYFELLLLFEISLQQVDGSTNILAYFPNWLRSSIKKGLYKVSYGVQDFNHNTLYYNIECMARSSSSAAPTKKN